VVRPAGVAAAVAAGTGEVVMIYRRLMKRIAEVLEDVVLIKPRTIAYTTGLLLVALVIALGACSKPAKPSAKVFPSPDDASNAMLAAVQSGDRDSILAIFGPEAKEIISSGDPVADKNVSEAFASKYGAMHRWRKLSDGGQILLVGTDNFPFPIPLRKNEGGQWFFDTAAGKDEILSRRIGRNELAIIDVCNAAADAQAEYFSQFHDGETTKQYAVKFISDPGKQNGLYWESPEGQTPSPLGPLAAVAASEGYSTKPDGPKAFHGYYFRILKGQTSKAPGGAKDYVVGGKMVGGFAFAAYPAEYGNSGVMTFIINQDGVLLQKDLGATTTETVTAMNAFDPDPGWSIVGE
jgi:hypothetical protein